MKPILLLTLIACLHLGCNKHERIYQTRVKGCVTDYFDGTNLQGVQVAVVYTYDYIAYNCGGCHLLVPDTVAKGTTNSKGEFSLKFRPLHFVSKTDGIENGPFDAPKKCGYLLVLYKPGTDYFTQYYNLHNGSKGRYHINYKLKPMVTIQYNVKAVNNKNVAVKLRINANSSFTSNFSYQHFLPFYGTNINNSYTIKTEWINEIEYNCNITDTINSLTKYNYTEGIITPTTKHYGYEITY